MAKKLTPLMEQYWSIKNAHSDKILLFRMGDFFEIFADDALVAAPILNIALTMRNKKSGDDTHMCGVPHHAIATPIAKLLEAGHKVAICDQIEDPKEAKGLVKRAVTRILSPGMVYDPETLDSTQSNFLCSLDGDHLAFLDSSTGEAFFYLWKNQGDVRGLIGLLEPTEIVLPVGEKEGVLSSLLEGLKKSSGEDYHQTYIDLKLIDQGMEFDVPGPAGLLLNYAIYMQGEEVLQALRPFEQRYFESRCLISPTVLRHLEVFATYKGEKQGSLFNAIDRTKTSSGARMLKNWLTFPLTDVALIEKRLKQVEKWVKDPARLKDLRKVFAGMGDIERRLGKIANPNCNPRDFLALAGSLESGLAVTEISGSKEDVSVASSVLKEIARYIDEEAPISFKKGGVINKGFSDELDELIGYAEESQKMLLAMEEREKEKTGIPTLKIRYNSVFGYYIEVTKTHTAKVPDHYKRKQTLTNAERYLTQELQELEEKILSARAKRVELEERLFAELRSFVLKQTALLLGLARSWAALDVVSSFAWLALENNYCRPEFSDNGDLRLKSSRHPVVEQAVSKAFVPNSLYLQSGECLLLTGPNMAGKSTIMRQVAVISMMAQMGAFVPAKEAVLPVFEQVFTRIGASDHLSEGLSTFMVEMQEAAEMIKSADKFSLVVLDEVGRGTSTYDGMSLAQAILEYLVSHSHSMVFFATHYHELTVLDRKFAKIKNAHMSIVEDKGDIQFLYTLANGPANKSYGIQVAKLAGLPRAVTSRAQKILDGLESFGQSEGGGLEVPKSAKGRATSGALGVSDSGQMNLLAADELPLFESMRESDLEKEVDERIEAYEKLVAKLKALSVPQLTPLEALNKLAEIQEQFES